MNWLEALLAAGAAYLAIGTVLGLIVFVGAAILIVTVVRDIRKIDKRWWGDD